MGSAADHFAAYPELREACVRHVYKTDEVQGAFEAAYAPKLGQFKIALDMVG